MPCTQQQYIGAVHVHTKIFLLFVSPCNDNNYEENNYDVSLHPGVGRGEALQWL